MTLDNRPRAIALMGPTASGKSSVALELAQRLGGEIVSVDSALVYRGLDIGAAKPTRHELAQVPHHLVDLRDPWQPYSAAEFAVDARGAIDGIIARGRLPILAGGTGLYFRALLEGLADMPEADEATRVAITAEAAERGWVALHAQLAQVDPVAAARIHATDAQRIQRALEVYRLSGRPISGWQRQAQRARLPLKVLKLVLAPPDRNLLHECIAARFDARRAGRTQVRSDDPAHAIGRRGRRIPRRVMRALAPTCATIGLRSRKRGGRGAGGMHGRHPAHDDKQEHRQQWGNTCPRGSLCRILS